MCDLLYNPCDECVLREDSDYVIRGDVPVCKNKPYSKTCMENLQEYTWMYIDLLK